MEKMRIDLHTHTEHSLDCDTSVRSLIKSAKRANLDAVAITDHDTMAGCREAEQMMTKDILVIPGMEITAKGGGHIIGLFLEREISSRDIFDIIDEIHKQDGLALIPHPYRPGSGLIYNMEETGYPSGEDLAEIIRKVDLIEEVNYRSENAEIIKTDKFLEFYPNPARAAGSDAHWEDEVGKAWLELEDFQSDSLEKVKAALLTSPRLLRFEAFGIDIESRIGKIRLMRRKRSILIRTGRMIINPIKRSLRAIYEKSSSKAKETESKNWINTSAK